MRRLLVLPLIISAAAVAQNSNNYAAAKLHYSYETSYVFKMRSEHNNTGELNLISSMAYKSHRISVKPDDAVDISSPYMQTKYSYDSGEMIDPTTYFEIKLSSPYKTGRQHRFKSADFNLVEHFSPRSVVSAAVKSLLEKQGEDFNQPHYRRAILRHEFLAGSYALQQTYTPLEQELRAQYENEVEYRDIRERLQFSLALNFNTENSARVEFGQQAAEAKNVSGLQFSSASNKLVDYLTNTLRSHDKVVVAYEVFSMTGQYPLYVSSWGESGVAKQPEVITPLQCHKNNGDKLFLCELTYRQHFLIDMPSAQQRSEYSMPKFLLDNMTRLGVTEKTFKAYLDQNQS
ncbi:hypothetical protein ACSLBF_19375 (plasmid) [Pseudoalteromonas sp. T1lg65]|uniref:hypothetical protein n=1 Tax=Pseudoalteromonas sp. T1lg65 TaxID=2077101 RepID=UPI003F791FB1